MHRIGEFALCYVVINVCPSITEKHFSDPSCRQRVMSYISDSINLSPIYVRLPERFFRYLLVLALGILASVEILSAKRLQKSLAVKYLSNRLPLFSDGIRLYVSLAMFAVFDYQSLRSPD